MNKSMTALVIKSVHSLDYREDSEMGSMINREGFADRRQHKRFQVHDGAFAVLRPRSDILGQVIDIVGQITDISEGGLMLHYIAGQNRSHEPFKLDIVVAGDSFRLDDIPFKAVSDMDMGDSLSFRPTTMRWQSVQFGALTYDQKAQLQYFIHNYAKTTVRFDYAAPIKKQEQRLQVR
jgi:hypothetical protein